MWSRKARQFLNKCRDFMAVTDDVRPAGYVLALRACAGCSVPFERLCICFRCMRTSPMPKSVHARMGRAC